MATPLFCFSSGRCGSTLFQQILNATGECAIQGEHGGLLSGVAESYFRIKETESFSEKLLSGSPHLAWENLFGPDEFDQAYRDFVEALFRDGTAVKYWGFKEISYGDGDRVIDFLRAIFPAATIVFLVRHPVDTVASKVNAWDWRPDLKAAADVWSRQMAGFLAHQGPGVHVLKYEEFTDPNSPVLQEFMNDLGLPADHLRERLEKKVYGFDYKISDVLDDREIDLIMGATRDVCLRFGYEDRPQ